VDDDGIWLDMIGCRGGDDGVIGLRMKMIKTRQCYNTYLIRDRSGWSRAGGTRWNERR